MSLISRSARHDIYPPSSAHNAKSSRVFAVWVTVPVTLVASYSSTFSPRIGVAGSLVLRLNGAGPLGVGYHYDGFRRNPVRALGFPGTFFAWTWFLRGFPCRGRICWRWCLLLHLVQDLGVNLQEVVLFAWEGGHRSRHSFGGAWTNPGLCFFTVQISR